MLARSIFLSLFTFGRVSQSLPDSLLVVERSAILTEVTIEPIDQFKFSQGQGNSEQDLIDTVSVNQIQLVDETHPRAVPFTASASKMPTQASKPLLE